MSTSRNTPVTGSFGATGVSSHFESSRGFNISLSGFGSATVDLERSFDKGTTWVVAKSYTADAEEVCDDPEVGVFYRFNASAYTSGTIVYRLSS
jgi:hypothetical protein